MVQGFKISADTQLGMGLGFNYSLDNLYKILGTLLGFEVKITPIFLVVVAVFLCLIIFALSSAEWKQLYAMTLLALWIPKFSYTYALVLLFLPVISFFYRSNSTDGRYDIVYMFLFAVMLIPYFLPEVKRVDDVLNLTNNKYPLSYGMLIINLAIIIMAILIIVDEVSARLNNKIGKEGK